MPAQYWAAGVPPFHTADGTAVTASGALTEVSPLPQILFPVPVLQEYDGKKFWIEAWGYYTTTGTQGTVTFDLRLGPAGAIGSMTSVVATSALTWVASSTNRIWRMEGNLQVRSKGSSGTCVGCMDFTNVTSGGKDLVGTAAGSTAAVDTTSARALSLGVTLSVASQSITCRSFSVVSVN